MREPQQNFVSSWRYYSNFYEGLRESLPLYKDGPLAGSYIKNSRGIRLNFFTENVFISTLFELSGFELGPRRWNWKFREHTFLMSFYHVISFWFLLVELRDLRMMLANDFPPKLQLRQSEFSHSLFYIFSPLNDIIDGILKSQRIFRLKKFMHFWLLEDERGSSQDSPFRPTDPWSEAYFYFRK